MDRNRSPFAGIALALVLALVAAATAGPAATAGAAPRPIAEGGGKVDLNRASAEELRAVPGIGPALSERIVKFREENGPFRRVDDLLKVRGIGEKSLEKMRPYLTVSEPSR
jgi:competence protein ComEA